MSDFQKCPVCREYGWLNETSSFMRHTCKPSWECRLCWHDDDEWDLIHADSSQSAAEKYAERYDSEGGDYAIINSRHRKDVIVMVRKDEEEQIEQFSIVAEAVPTYSATKITETIGSGNP